MKSTACASPAATVKPPANGLLRNASVKTASFSEWPLRNAAAAIVSS